MAVRQKPKKIKINISIESENYAWIKEKIEDKTFRNVSHGFDRCIYLEKKRERTTFGSVST